MKHIHIRTWEPENVLEVKIDGSLQKWKVGRISLIWTEERPKKRLKNPTIPTGRARKSRL